MPGRCFLHVLFVELELPVQLVCSEEQMRATGAAVKWGLLGGTKPAGMQLG